jgi:uncharacterized protein
MTRAVLDSSVLVSAFLTPEGLPGVLLRQARGGAFSLHLASEIVAETRQALLREPKLQERYRYTSKDVEEFANGLAASAQLAANLPAVTAVESDPKDSVIVACALQANADYLVTGDRHLLSLGEYAGIRIVTPRQFLDLTSD